MHNIQYSWKPGKALIITQQCNTHMTGTEVIPGHEDGKLSQRKIVRSGHEIYERLS